MRSHRSRPSRRAATGGGRSVFASPRWLGGAFAALFAVGCVTDHHELAEQPPGSGGAGGYGGEVTSHAGAAGEPEHDSGTVVSRDGGGGDDAGRMGPPSGPVVVTLLNGVTDSPWIGFCFAAVHGGKPAPLSGEIAPPGGIEYAHSATVGSVSGAVLGTDDLLPFVVAARGADVVSGVDCRQILARATAASDDHGASDGSASEAGAVDRDAALSLQDATTLLDGDSGGSPAGPEPVPPIAEVRVTELPVIPAAAFLEARSFLLALGGCLGGRGVTDPSEKSVCGEHYTPSTPTLSVGILKLPHGAPKDHIGLSFLGGTPAVRLITMVELLPGVNSNPYTFAKSIPAGGVRPAPPDVTHTVSDLGADAMGSIEVFADANPAPIYAEQWQTTFAASGVASAENGHDYTLVLVGPYPGFSRNKWWNEPVVTIVDSEP